MLNRWIPCFGCVLIVAGSFLTGPVHAGGVPIAADGQAMAVIVVPDETGDTELYAANELQAYLGKISGAQLPVKAESGRGDRPFISIGRTRLAATERERLAGETDDAFLVTGAPGGIVLAGGGESGRAAGTLYAVYDFLERELGCRWLGPNELWEHVPQKTKLVVSPEDRLERPAFRYRLFSPENWAIKHKANISGRVQWPFDWIGERSRGEERPPFNMPGWSGFHSGPRQLLPASGRNVDRGFRRLMLTKHPDWFALQRNGARSSGHFCHGTEEVVDLMADRLSQMLRERPHKHFVQLGEGDGMFRSYCRCEYCLELDAQGDGSTQTRRGTHTYRWIHYCNRVADLLAESDPDRKLLSVAYDSYQEPPDPEIIRPAPNMMIDYFTWAGNLFRGFEHDSESHARYRGWIESWQEMTPAGVIMAEYLSRSAMDRVTGTQPRRFVRDMRYLQRIGYTGYRAFINVNSWGMFGINRYAGIKAMWNPEIDEEELVRDYCDHAFHAASEAMQNFVNTIEKGMEEYGGGWKRQPEVMAEARRHLDDAHAAAEGDPVVQQRLIPMEVHFHYAFLSGPAWHKLLEGAYRQRDPELLRRGLEEGRAAIEYRNEMRNKYRDHPDRSFLRTIGHRMNSNLRAGSTYKRRLEALERRDAE